MGAGCHAHPDGTQAGAAALVQAMEAYQKKKSIEAYAKKNPELKKAMLMIQCFRFRMDTQKWICRGECSKELKLF